MNLKSNLSKTKGVFIETTKLNVMENRLTKNRFIQTSAVKQINEATIVLRHFIELSAKLLPFLNELSKKTTLLPHEKNDRDKIIEVYHNYSFDTSTSEILMESDILKTIQDTFKSIEKRKVDHKSDADKLITVFQNKHQQLVRNWTMTDKN